MAALAHQRLVAVGQLADGLRSRRPEARLPEARMTKRKPAGRKFESWIDAQIDAATAAGEFENLPGHGQPLEGLGEADDPLWWAK